MVTEPEAAKLHFNAVVNNKKDNQKLKHGGK